MQCVCIHTNRPRAFLTWFVLVLVHLPKVVVIERALAACKQRFPVCCAHTKRQRDRVAERKWVWKTGSSPFVLIPLLPLSPQLPFEMWCRAPFLSVPLCNLVPPGFRPLLTGVKGHQLRCDLVFRSDTVILRLILQFAGHQLSVWRLCFGLVWKKKVTRFWGFFCCVGTSCVTSVLPPVGSYCNRTWDGWLCWGDSAPGTVMQMCPAYFADFDPAGEAFTSNTHTVKTFIFSCPTHPPLEILEII